MLARSDADAASQNSSHYDWVIARCNAKCCSECSQRDAHAHDTASNILGLESFAALAGRGARWKRRNLSVQPVLLIGKREPSLCHPRVATEGRLALGVLRQLQAVFSIFPECV